MNDAAIAGFYEPEFFALSNFSAFAVTWQGREFATAEHAYQWASLQHDNDNIDAREAQRIASLVIAARSPVDAKAIVAGHKHLRRPTWLVDKVGVMASILAAKLDQHAYVADTLEATGTLRIVETSPFDSFWGWGLDRKGDNHLGRLWERLRDDRRKRNRA